MCINLRITKEELIARMENNPSLFVYREDHGGISISIMRSTTQNKYYWFVVHDISKITETTNKVPVLKESDVVYSDLKTLYAALSIYLSGMCSV